ncbi:MAG: C4-type zinc ribbon domain-containing protein [Acidimicrobiia bacterium]
MSELEALLVVQQHDTAIDRLRHRAATLPERAERDARVAVLASIDRRLADAQARRDVVAREVQRLDDEGSSLEARAVAVERRMYSGEVSSPKELQAMQHDVESLRRHRDEIDDRELGVMSEREVLDGEVGAIEAERAQVAGDVERLQAAIAEQVATIDVELAVEQSARDEHASSVGAALLEQYESCRRQARGVGVAKLVGNTCQGCHLTIPATEVDRMRHQPPGSPALCDNCGCILVLS